MIYPEKAANQPPIHTTLVFKPLGLLDNQEMADALSMLGASGTTWKAERGPWLACGLDSDGTIRLWPLIQRT